MKNELTIKGMEIIGDMKFHKIEGGFGEGKRAILVKEIADIHGKTISAINQAINMNRKRFVDGVDIIDFKGTDLAINLIDSGIYTQNSVNASTNIYALSERGYAKLLKILEDDSAWEKHDQLVDGYFNMRQAIRNTPEALDMDKHMRAEAMLINAKNRTAKTLIDIFTAAGVPASYQLAALKDTYATVGINVSLTGMTVEHRTYEATEIAKRLGIYSNSDKPHGQAVSAIIEQLGISLEESVRVPGIVNGHAMTTMQYTDSVVEKVSAWLSKHSKPSIINKTDGSKSFTVQYK